LRYNYKKKIPQQNKDPKIKKGNISETNFIIRKNKGKQLKSKKGANKKPFIINKTPV